MKITIQFANAGVGQLTKNCGTCIARVQHYKTQHHTTITLTRSIHPAMFAGDSIDFDAMAAVAVECFIYHFGRFTESLTFNDYDDYSVMFY